MRASTRIRQSPQDFIVQVKRLEAQFAAPAKGEAGDPGLAALVMGAGVPPVGPSIMDAPQPEASSMDAASSGGPNSITPRSMEQTRRCLQTRPIGSTLFRPHLGAVRMRLKSRTLSPSRPHRGAAPMTMRPSLRQSKSIWTKCNATQPAVSHCRTTMYVCLCP